MKDVPSIAFQYGDGSRFTGAKVAVFVGSQIVTILRDDKPTIPYPNYWDLTGGGREGHESAWECAARECFEEVSLRISKADLLWGRLYKSLGQQNWFFIARVDASRQQELHLRDEGQALQLMSVDEYLTHPKAISRFQSRLSDWIAGQ